jgi:hypothetical protein
MGPCRQHEGTVGRRPPALIRQQETICRSHQADLHRLPGLGPAVNAAITAAEHGPLKPGEIAAAFRAWDTMARRGLVYRPASDPCGYPECCGPGPRGDLERAIRALSRRARPGLRQAVSRLDEIYLSRTLHDPRAHPGAPWWERRRPIGWLLPGSR